MEGNDMIKTVGDRVEEQRKNTVQLSDGKRYYLDTINKRLRNVDNYCDAIDIEYLLRMRGRRIDAEPKLIVREDSIILDCKCGKMLFVNPEWKRFYRTPYAMHRDEGQ